VTFIGSLFIQTLFGLRAFSTDGPQAWNRLPADVRSFTATHSASKHNLKTFLFSIAYELCIFCHAVFLRFTIILLRLVCLIVRHCHSRLRKRRYTNFFQWLIDSYLSAADLLASASACAACFIALAFSCVASRSIFSCWKRIALSCLCYIHVYPRKKRLVW